MLKAGTYRMGSATSMLLFAALSLQVLAQGPLTPPGPPGETMKNLGQIEPRTPISSVPYIITQAGSYYLTTNLAAGSGQNGIEVQADDVTIDLAGFTLRGVGFSTGDGINQANTLRNLTVLNGNLVNWRANGKSGVSAGASARVVGVNASSNWFGFTMGRGSLLSQCSAQYNFNKGIVAGDGSMLSECLAQDNTGEGIRAGVGSTLASCVAVSNYTGIYAYDGCTLTSCSASGNKVIGISANQGSTLTGCAASYNASNGINVAIGSTLTDCSAFYNAGDGFYTADGCTIIRCSAAYNAGDGIQISSRCRVENCTAIANGRGAGTGAGIHAPKTDSRIDGNDVKGNDLGLYVEGTGNLIVRNSSRDLNEISVTNKIGTIITLPEDMPSAGAWANFAY